MRLTEDQYARLQSKAVSGVARTVLPPRPSEKPSPGRPTKYRSKRCEYAGLKFGSKDELARWKDLQLMQKAGAIAGLQHQPKFDLRVNGQLVCRYEADSRYTLADGHDVVEDVKSKVTRKNRAYRIKWKLMKACHDIQISEYM